MSGDAATLTVTAADGRGLSVAMSGDEGARPLLYHSGTPSGPVVDPRMAEAAAAQGLRLITYGRPGYGESDPLPGRSVAQAAEDTAAVLDHLGVGPFLTFGISGGGPHALACAAMLPERCLAAASVSGIAPYDAPGLDWLAGMGEDNIEELSLTLKGREALAPYLEVERLGLAVVQGDEIVASLESLLPEVDREVLTGALADHLAASFRLSVSRGIDGWLDDDLAFAQPWGFDLSAITVPVAVWQGGADLMVPSAHGEWLGAHVAGALLHLEPEHGHISLHVAHLPAILADLVALAGGTT